MKIEHIFDNNGNFKITGYDPYRNGDNREYQKYHEYLFDKEGDARWRAVQEVEVFIKKHNCSPFCDAVKYYYSKDWGANTKYNYSSVYVWR